MGVCLGYRRVGPAQLDRFLAAPAEVVPFLEREHAQGLDQWRERYRAGVEIDIDKAWDAAHFCLTGCGGKTTDPRGMIRADTRTLGREEFGLGRPWAVLPSEVAAFATAIANVSVKEMFARYEPAAMRSHGVYLAGSLEEAPESFDYVWGHFCKLRDFVQGAAASGDGLIGWMT